MLIADVTSMFDVIIDLYPPPPLQDLNSQEMERQQAVQKLVSLTEDYIKTMAFGLQRYSRPLLHEVISPIEHNTLFGNIEKVSSTTSHTRNTYTTSG